MLVVKRERKGIYAVKKYWLWICLVCVLAGIAGYFVNIMVIKNKEEMISVLVLSAKANEAALEREITRQFPISEGEEVVIQVMDPSVEANYGIVLTWLRARTVDVLIGETDALKRYAQSGCLADWSELEVVKEEEIKRKDEAFLCGLAEYDDEGGILRMGEEQCFGWRSSGEVAEACGLKQPVVSVALNAPHKEAALNATRLLTRNK